MNKTVFPNRIATIQAMRWFLWANRQRRYSEVALSGFTLIELLIAATLTSIVLTLAGQGVVAMMQAENRIGSEITRRTNLNRSLEFIADEIRMAKSVSTPASGAVPTPTCGTATGVLSLTMPDNSSILYYVHNMSACSSSVWIKPAVIRRVANGSDTVLVDALTTPTTLPVCTTSRTGGSGFYACIESNSRSAQLFLYGLLTNSSGNSSGTYLSTSRITARSF